MSTLRKWRKGKKTASKSLAILLTLAMALGLSPMDAFALGVTVATVADSAATYAATLSPDAVELLPTGDNLLLPGEKNLPASRNESPQVLGFPERRPSGDGPPLSSDENLLYPVGESLHTQAGEGLRRMEDSPGSRFSVVRPQALGDGRMALSVGESLRTGASHNLSLPTGRNTHLLSSESLLASAGESLRASVGERPRPSVDESLTPLAADSFRANVSPDFLTVGEGIDSLSDGSVSAIVKSESPIGGNKLGAGGNILPTTARSISAADNSLSQTVGGSASAANDNLVSDAASSSTDTESPSAPFGGGMSLMSAASDLPPPEICAIGTTGYITFANLLADLKDGDTIKLLAETKHSGAWVIDGISVTVDLNYNNLIITNSAFGGTAVLARNGGSVSVIGQGEFNASGDFAGASVRAGGQLTLTNATGTGTQSAGVYISADGGSPTAPAGNIRVLKDAKGVIYGAAAMGPGSISIGDDSYKGGATGQRTGAHAENGGRVTVAGNSSGDSFGAVCDGVGSLVKIGGDAKAQGKNTTTGVGAEARNGGAIEVEGDAVGVSVGASIAAELPAGTPSGLRSANTSVTVQGYVRATGAGGVGVSNQGGMVAVNSEIQADVYIRVPAQPNVGPADAVTLSCDDYKLTGPTGDNIPEQFDGHLWFYYEREPGGYCHSFTVVKPNTYVCSIGVELYEDLATAFAFVRKGETIKMLKNYTYNSGLTVDGASDFCGSFTVNLNGFRLNINNPDGVGLLVTNKGSLGISGKGELNVRGTTDGVVANSGGKATVTTAFGGGAPDYPSVGVRIPEDNDGSSVTVKKSAMGSYSGVVIHSKGSVTVGSPTEPGFSIGDNECGVIAQHKGKVEVYGDAIGKISGVFATDRGTSVRVSGDAKCTMEYPPNDVDRSSFDGVYAAYGARVTVTGSVEGWDYGVFALDEYTADDFAPGTQTIQKKLSDHSWVEVGGDVTAKAYDPTGFNNGGVGVANSDSFVFVDGEIRGRYYILTPDGLYTRKIEQEEYWSPSEFGNRFNDISFMEDYRVYVNHFNGFDRCFTLVYDSLLPKVCEIVGGKKYTSLRKAMDEVHRQVTEKLLEEMGLGDLNYEELLKNTKGRKVIPIAIRLLQHIGDTEAIVLYDVNMTILTDGYNLHFGTGYNTVNGLYAVNSSFTAVGGGEVRAFGQDCGVALLQGSKAALTSAESHANTGMGSGAVVLEGSSLTLDEYAKGWEYGLDVEDAKSTATVQEATGNVNNPSSIGARAANEATLTVLGSAVGGLYGVLTDSYPDPDTGVTPKGGAAKVGGDAKGGDIGAFAIYAGSSVTVGGDAIGENYGAYKDAYGAQAADGAKVTVDGDAVGVYAGAGAFERASAIVKGNAEGGAIGAIAETAATVRVDGDVTGTGSGGTGALAQSLGQITVGGSARGVQYGAYTYGYAYNAEKEKNEFSTIKITGSVFSESRDGIGAVSGNGGAITVSGSVGSGGRGAVADGALSKITVAGEIAADYIGAGAQDGGTVDVAGRVTGDFFGVTALGAGSKAKVAGNVSAPDINEGVAVFADGGGDVTVKGAATGGLVGASAYDGGTATIDGKLKASCYIVLDDILFNESAYAQKTTKRNYLTYTDAQDKAPAAPVNTVWVKGQAAPPPKKPGVMTFAYPGEQPAEGGPNFAIISGEPFNLSSHEYSLSLDGGATLSGVVVNADRDSQAALTYGRPEDGVLVISFMLSANQGQNNIKYTVALMEDGIGAGIEADLIQKGAASIPEAPPQEIPDATTGNWYQYPMEQALERALEQVSGLTTLSSPLGLFSSPPVMYYQTTNGMPPGPLTYSAYGLPSGLGVDGGSGVISGVPGEYGIFGFTVYVSDRFGGESQIEASIYIEELNSEVSIESANIPAGVQGAAYGASFTAGGGDGEYTWTLRGLPSGLSYNAQTGAVSGAAAVAGHYTVFVYVTDGEGNYAYTNVTMTIRPAGVSDYEAVQADAAALTWAVIRGDNSSQNAVTSALTLPVTGANGSQILWASDNRGVVIDLDGGVSIQRPPFEGADATGDIHALVRRGVEAEIVSFDLKVLKSQTPVFVPVTAIVGLPEEAEAGEPTALSGTVLPGNSTNWQITWSVKDDGGTGAAIIVGSVGPGGPGGSEGGGGSGSGDGAAGYSLLATGSGTAILTAAVEDGLAPGEPFILDFPVVITGEPFTPFVPVTDITGVPESVYVKWLTDLGGVVQPLDATDRQITWSIIFDGGAGASLSGADNGSLYTEKTGIVILTATVADGRAPGVPFVLSFTINSIEGPEAPFTPVADITGVRQIIPLNSLTSPGGDVWPIHATNRWIEWSIKDDGGTDAILSSNKLISIKKGTVTVTATIEDGLAPGEPFVRDFSIEIGDGYIFTSPLYGGTNDFEDVLYWTRLYADRTEAILTVNLNADYDYVKSVPGVYNGAVLMYYNERLNINLKGHRLTITNPVGNGVFALAGSVFTGTGDGEININGAADGVICWGGKVEVTNVVVNSTESQSSAVNCSEDQNNNASGSVRVRGDVTDNRLAGTGIYTYAVYAAMNAEIVIDGNLRADAGAVRIDGDAARVTVRGDVSAGANWVGGANYAINAGAGVLSIGGNLTSGVNLISLLNGSVTVEGSMTSTWDNAASIGVNVGATNCGGAAAALGGPIRGVATVVRFGSNSLTAADGVLDGEPGWPGFHVYSWPGYRAKLYTNREQGVFVPVTDITGIPEAAVEGATLTLVGAVVPASADNKTIIWNVKETGGTGASIIGGALSLPAPGTAVVTATVTDGAGAGAPFIKDFNILVHPSFVPVERLTGVPAEATAGRPVTFDYAVEPSFATNKNAVWSVRDAGATGAAMHGATLLAEAAGTVVVTAAIEDGAAPGTVYTQDFTIAVGAGGKTLYIVDSVQNDDEYLWADAENAVAALSSGDTLDISRASGPDAPVEIKLNNKPVVIRGDPGKTYENLMLRADGDLSGTATGWGLTLRDLKFSAPAGEKYALALGLADPGGTAELTLIGDNEVTNTNASGYGLYSKSNFIVNGAGSLTATGVLGGVFLDGGMADVRYTADIAGDAALYAVSTRNGSAVNGGLTTYNPWTVRGEGTLFAHAAGNLGNGVYPRHDLTFSGGLDLRIEGGGGGSGVYVQPASSELVTLTFDLPQPLTVTGGATGSGISFVYGSTGAAALRNDGAELTFRGGAEATGYVGTGHGINRKIGTLYLIGNRINALGGGAGSGMAADGGTLNLVGLNQDFAPKGGPNAEISISEVTISGAGLRHGGTIVLGRYDFLPEGGENGGAGIYGASHFTRLTPGAVTGKVVARGVGGDTGYGIMLYYGNLRGFGPVGPPIEVYAQGAPGCAGLFVDESGYNTYISGNLLLTVTGGAGASPMRVWYITSGDKVPALGFRYSSLSEPQPTLVINSDAGESEADLYRFERYAASNSAGLLPWHFTGDGVVSAGNGATDSVEYLCPAGGSFTVTLDKDLPYFLTPEGALTSERLEEVAVLGQAYSVPILISSPTPVQIRVAQGALPPGLTLDGTTGLISGVLAQAGTFNFSLVAENAKGVSLPIAYRIDVNETAKPVIAEYGGSYYTKFELAWADATAGIKPGTDEVTIKLLGDAVTDRTLFFSKSRDVEDFDNVRKIILDIGPYNLDVIVDNTIPENDWNYFVYGVPAGPGYGTYYGLHMSHCNLELISDGGKFNVTGYDCGVYANNSDVTIDNVTATNGTGIEFLGYSVLYHSGHLYNHALKKLTVRGDVRGNDQSGGYGAYFKTYGFASDGIRHSATMTDAVIEGDVYGGIYVSSHDDYFEDILDYSASFTVCGNVYGKVEVDRGIKDHDFTIKGDVYGPVTVVAWEYTPQYPHNTYVSEDDTCVNIEGSVYGRVGVRYDARVRIGGDLVYEYYPLSQYVYRPASVVQTDLAYSNGHHNVIVLVEGSIYCPDDVNVADFSYIPVGEIIYDRALTYNQLLLYQGDGDYYTYQTLTRRGSNTLYMGKPRGDEFTPVTDIRGLPETAYTETPLTLSGVVDPSNATNRKIVWSIKDARDTGAAIDGKTFLAHTPGTALVTAAIANGLAPGEDFVMDFEIRVLRQLDYIEARELPYKLAYFVDDPLDLTGLVVYAVYTDGYECEITNYGTYPEHGAALRQIGTRAVEISYSEGPIYVFDYFNVEVAINPEGAPVCEIVETGVRYSSLDGALADHVSGQTIRLLADIHHYRSIELYSKICNLDLNGFDLTVDVKGNVSWYAVVVYYGSQLNLVGSKGGELNVIADGIGVDCYGENNSATVNNIIAGGTGVDCQGAGSSVTVNNVTTFADDSVTGVVANNGASVTVNGSVSNFRTGVYSQNGGTVLVRGDVYAEYQGVSINNSGSVSGGAFGEIEIGGNVISETYGVEVTVRGADRGVLRVGGDVVAVYEGIYTSQSGTGVPEVFVDGFVSITSPTNICVYANGGLIDVTGGVNSAGGGVYANGGAQVTLGALTASEEMYYINIGGGVLTPDDYVTPTTKDSYLTYTNGVSSVWVREAGLFTPVTGITGVPDSVAAGSPLTLTGRVAPANATNKVIAWSVKDAGATGAAIDGGVLLAPSAGEVVVLATIVNGLAPGTDYTQDFVIAVIGGLQPAALTGIEVTVPPDKAEYVAGEPLDLAGLVVTAFYDDGSSKALPPYDDGGSGGGGGGSGGGAFTAGYVTDPAQGDRLNAAGTQTVVVSYTEGGVTKTDSFDVEVARAVLSGEIAIGAYKWDDFRENVTYGLFYKSARTATITASADGVIIEYFLAEKALTAEELNGVADWQVYAGAIGLAPNNKYIVYARLTDEDGGGVGDGGDEDGEGDGGGPLYINSDGVALYTDSEPMSEYIEYTISGGGDGTAEVLLYGNTVRRIWLGASELTAGGDFAASDEGTVTLKAGYLNSLAPGDYALTIHYNPMGEEYVDAPGNEAPEMTSLALIIREARVALDRIAVTTPPDKAEYTAGEALDLTGMVVTAYYSDGGEADVTALTAANPARGTTLLRVGTQFVEILYTEGGVTMTDGFDVTVGEAPVYGLSLNTAEHTFPAAAKGYGSQAAKTVMASNTGNRGTGALSISVAGDDAAFRLTASSMTSIDVGGFRMFSLAPVTGLAEGDYAAAVTVSGQNGISESFTVKFKVNSTTAVVTLDSILVTTPPDKAEYDAGDALDLAGMVVTAYYSNGGQRDVTALVVTAPTAGAPLMVAGGQSVAVSYTEGGLTKTDGFTVTVVEVTHVHDWDGGVETAPTCTEQGYTTYTCLICGATEVRDYVSALGHDWDGGVETEPTCTEQGYTIYTCLRCGETDTRDYVAATGHDWDGGAVTTPATCELDGVMTFTCMNCGDKRTEPIPAAGHDWSARVSDPTCTEQGFTTYTCLNCGEADVRDYIAALGHDWDGGVVTVEPTEEDEGEMLYTCLRCGETRTAVIPTKDHVHDYDREITQPTCTEQGYTEYYCVCGDEYISDYVAALGHDFSVLIGHEDASCEESGYDIFLCSRCDETETRVIQATGHNWAVDEVTPPTCTERGYTTYICQNCGETKTGDYTTAGHIEGPGVVTREPTAASPGERTYYCTVCGEILRTEPIPATGQPGVSPGGNGGSPTGSGSPAPPPVEKPPANIVIEDDETPLAAFTTSHISYLSGYPDGSVAPDKSITRAEMCALLFRLLEDGGKNAAIDAVFPDVKQGVWYYQPVAYLAHLGVVVGYPDGTFKPEAPITRAEFVTVISRFFELTPGGGSRFTDIATHWAQDGIIAVENKGWISGYPDGTFRPDNNLTRAEAVALINRMLDRSIDAADLPDWAASYTDLAPSHWAYADLIEASVGHLYERKENGKELWTSPDEPAASKALK